MPVLSAFLIFCLSVGYFVAAGPWRALQVSNAYDFAPIYASTRLWLDGQNPYDMRSVTREVHTASPKFSRPGAIEPSVYSPTLFPLVIPLALLSWPMASLLWVCLSTVVFAVSVPLLFINSDVSAAGRWLLGAGVFSFSPTLFGLSHGNPIVLSCSLTMLAVFLVMNGRIGFAALTLGLAHCIKPQISICAVALFALWGYWRPLLLSFTVPALSALISMLRAPSLAEYWHWLTSLQQTIAATTLPGAINDVTLSNQWANSIVNLQTLFAVWVHNPVVVNTISGLIAGALVLCYLKFRGRFEGDRRLRDMAFFAALTLTYIYHRFYDEQILLLSVPLLATFTATRKAIVIGVALCVLALWFPLHLIAILVPDSMTPRSLLGLFLLRPQPMIIVGMCLLLVPWGAKTVEVEVERARSAHA